MFARPLLLLSVTSFLLVRMPLAFASPPAIELDVPKYNYPEADATNGEGIANDGSIVGQSVLHGL